MKKTTLLPYLLILPTLLFVAVFTVYPTLYSLGESFFLHRLNIPKYRVGQFAGLENYAQLCSSPLFQQILANTFLYVLVLVPLSVTAGLLFAMWLRHKRFQRLRVAMFHPAILPVVSAATIWLFFFTPDYGLFNAFLRLFGYSGPENWVANPSMALWSLLIVAFWKNSSFYMIYFLAGLQNLPEDVFEALKLEGASKITVFFRFTLPLLRRSTLFVSTIAIIDAFRMVDHVFVLTSGGPSNRSSLLLYYLWQVRFDQLNLGQAAAITVILLLILLGFTIANFLFQEPRGDSGE